MPQATVQDYIKGASSEMEPTTVKPSVVVSAATFLYKRFLIEEINHFLGKILVWDHMILNKYLLTFFSPIYLLSIQTKPTEKHT